MRARRISGHRLQERTLAALYDAAIGLRVRNTTYRTILRHQWQEDISSQVATLDLRAGAAWCRSRPVSVAAFDDILPRNALEAARVRRTRAWAGDVYKAVQIIAHH